jgi:hypothetical protein
VECCTVTVEEWSMYVWIECARVQVRGRAGNPARAVNPAPASPASGGQARPGLPVRAGRTAGYIHGAASKQAKGPDRPSIYMWLWLSLFVAVPSSHRAVVVNRGGLHCFPAQLTGARDPRRPSWSSGWSRSRQPWRFRAHGSARAAARA